MSKKVKKHGEYNSIGAYSTLALSDNSKTLPDTKMPIPSQDQVERAKHWVDENEK